MQNTSTLYNNLLTDPNHSFECRLDINGVNYGQDAILSAKTSFRVFESAPTIGGVYSSTLDFSIILPANTTIPRMAFVRPYFHAVSNGTGSEWYPLGYFYIDTRTTSRNNSNINVFKAFCYDVMLKANAEYNESSLSWPATDIDVVNEIATKMGTYIDYRTQSIMTEGYSIPFPVGKTYRDVLSYIAVMYCGNWVSSVSGNLLLMPLPPTGGNLDVGDSASTLSTSPTRSAYTKVQIALSEDSEDVVEVGSSDARVMTATCPYMTQAIAGTIYNTLSSFAYTPFTANGVWSNPAVELGDTVTINGFSGTVYALDYTFGSGMVMDMSAPNDDYIDHEYAYESPTSRSYKKTMGQMSTAIEQNEEAVRITAEKLSNIGGRNYAWAVSQAYHPNNFIIRNCTSTYDPSQNGKYVLTASAASSSFTQISAGYYDMPSDLIGQKVIFHADVIEPSRTELNSKVYIVVGNSGGSQIVAYALTPDTKSLTFTVPSNAAKLNVLLRVAQTQSLVAAGDVLTVSGVKLERGTVATDWTPAPEDDASAIAANKTAIEVNSEGLSSKVSNTDYNGQTIASLINQSAATVQIEAPHINLNGVVTANDNVQILTDGTIKAVNADISGKFTMTDGSVNINTSSLTESIVSLNYGDYTSQMMSRGFVAEYKENSSNTPWVEASGELYTGGMMLQDIEYTSALDYSGGTIEMNAAGPNITVRAATSTTSNRATAYLAPTGLTFSNSSGTQIITLNTSDGMIYNDASTSNKRMQLFNGGIRFYSSTGTLLSQYIASRSDHIIVNDTGTAVSVPSSTSTMTELCSLTLTAGVWILFARVLFPTNATGYRQCLISTVSGSANAITWTGLCKAPAIAGASTDLICSTYYNTSGTTLYLNVRQNSGSALSCKGYIQAVRIA